MAGRRWLSVLHGAWRPCDLPRLEMRMGVSFETRRSTSLCSCRFNSPLRVVCLACCAAVCLFVGVVAAPRAAALPWAWFGLQFRFALWFSVDCWMYARDERVEPTEGCTEVSKIYSTDWTRDIRVVC